MSIKKHKILFMLLLVWNTVALADDYPCEGPNAMLALVNRPSVLDSPCTVPYKKGIIEMGYQYQTIYPGNGYQHNFPDATIRMGLPSHTEFVVILPNYIHQTVIPRNGYTASVIGIKHNITTTMTTQTTIESLITLPSGSKNFGSNGTGFALNGIIGHSFTPRLSVTAQLGIATQTPSNASGGQHYTSLNPDIVVSWSLDDKSYVYGEVTAQTNTGPSEGRGLTCNTGIVYLFRTNVTVDAEVGQRIIGQTSFARYLGTGFAYQF